MFDRISELTITRRANSTSKNRHKRRFEIENLESRQVMAANVTAALGADGILRVEGTPNNDQIVVRNEAGKVRVEGVAIKVDVPLYGTFMMNDVASTSISTIQVSALAGNDTVRMVETLTGGSVAIGMTIYGGAGSDTLSGGSARDTIMGGEKFNTEQTGQAAARLDAQHKFYSAGAEWLNHLGKNEKWFFGGTNVWHYIKPNGEIWKWTGTGDGAKLATVDPNFHTNLPTLLDADSGSNAAQLDRLYQLYSTGNLSQNWGGRNEKWVMSQAENKWYFITPDGTVYRQTQSGYAIGEVAATLDVSYWNDINRLVNASTLFADNDTIYGYGGKDDLLGGADADTIYGGVENDFLGGGIGKDTLMGEGGEDYLRGDDGNDTLLGGTENDDLVGEDGADYLRGDLGNDKLWGGSERNTTLYSNDNDWLYGEAGNDELHGGAGVDYLFGNDDDDMLWGDTGVDYLYGGNHNDALYGGAAADFLYGEAGNDGLFGGYEDSLTGTYSAGTDSIYGGTGADRFLTDLKDVPKDQESADARVYFLYGDKHWTDAEIETSDKGLAWLHKSTGNTKLLKQSNGGLQTIYRVGDLRDGVAGENDGLGTIRIANLGANVNLSRNIVHEFGHNWHSPATVPGFAALSGWKVHNLSAAQVPSGYSQATNNGVKEGWFGSDGKYYCWIYQTSAKFARDYGRTSPDEDFATCLEEYYAVKSGLSSNPSSNWQAKHNFVATWLFNKAF